MDFDKEAGFITLKGGLWDSLNVLGVHHVGETKIETYRLNWFKPPQAPSGVETPTLVPDWTSPLGTPQGVPVTQP